MTASPIGARHDAIGNQEESLRNRKQGFRLVLEQKGVSHVQERLRKSISVRLDVIRQIICSRQRR